MIITIILTIIAILIVILILGKVTRSIQFNQQVKALFSSPKNITPITFNCEQLSGLPEPVQRYFKYALKEGQPYISYARLRHGGQFRTNPNQRWMSINGQQYYTTEEPGFVWLGKVPAKASLISAIDMYQRGRGSMDVKLLSIIKIVEATGEELDQGALLRWLAEAAWFPTALLPSENLSWEPIDHNSAKIILFDNNLMVSGAFTFNEQGQITQFKTKRYKDSSLKDWFGYYGDYREVDGMRIPFYAEVVWGLESGDFSYAKFELRKVDYNIAEKY